MLYLCGFLCAFAPLREPVFCSLSLPPEIEPQLNSLLTCSLFSRMLDSRVVTATGGMLPTPKHLLRSPLTYFLFAIFKEFSAFMFYLSRVTGNVSCRLWSASFITLLMLLMCVASVPPVAAHNGTQLVDVPSAQNFQTRQVCWQVTSLSKFVTGQAASPAEATVTISGRVTNEYGRGIGRVTVYLQDLAIGTVQIAQTRGDGSYAFTDVPLYNYYTVTAQHRLYDFTPGIQSFSLIEEMRHVNFTATRR